MGDKKKQLEDLLLDKTFEYLQYSIGTNDKHEYVSINDEESITRLHEIGFIKDIYDSVSKHPDQPVKTEIEHTERILKKLRDKFQDTVYKYKSMSFQTLTEYERGNAQGMQDQAEIALNLINNYL